MNEPLNESLADVDLFVLLVDGFIVFNLDYLLLEKEATLPLTH